MQLPDWHSSRRADTTEETQMKASPCGAHFIDMLFEILHGLQHGDGKTVILLEPDARKGLEFADLG